MRRECAVTTAISWARFPQPDPCPLADSANGRHRPRISSTRRASPRSSRSDATVMNGPTAFSSFEIRYRSVL
jgi:hypothetical protein